MPVVILILGLVVAYVIFQWAKESAEQEGHSERVRTRQEGRSERTETRQEGKTDRTEERQEGKDEKRDDKTYRKCCKSCDKDANRSCCEGKYFGPVRIGWKNCDSDCLEKYKDKCYERCAEGEDGDDDG